MNPISQSSSPSWIAFLKATIPALKILSGGILFYLSSNLISPTDYLKWFPIVPMGLGLFFITDGLESLRKLRAVEMESQAGRSSAEDRLDELERLKRRDMVTPEEYSAKRREILKEL